jgi:anaerobic magnesium-protoporphyrin IX monomethyl ester cyclase
MSTGVVGKLGEKLLVFDALDNWVIHPEVRTGMKSVKKGYDIIKDKSDLIFTNSQPLKEFLGRDRDDVHCVLNGVSPEHFIIDKSNSVPEDLQRIPRPRIGYTGKLSRRLDIGLVSFLAARMPESNFVFVGPVLNRKWIKPLFEFKNIHLLGDKHYSKLPAYIAALDVCLIPHDVDHEVDGDPLKLYEYLFSGKPVVSTDIPGVDAFEDVISIARTKEDFLEAINKYLALSEIDGEGMATVLRNRIPSSCFWETKADQMIEYIGTGLKAKEKEVVNREIGKKGDLKIHLVFAPPVVMPKLGELGEGRIPPLGIMYLASYLREKIYNVEIKITDGLLLGFEETMKEVETFQPDILGISYYTASAGGAMALADHMKDRYPDIFIVSGGPHATELPEESLNRSNMDVIVLGEGEVTFRELVDLYQEGDHGSSIRLSEVDGIAFKEGEHVRRTTPRAPISDLDSIPFPARDLIDMQAYKGWYLNKETTEGAVLFARGCPYDCTFCSNIVWRIQKPYLRLRSPENIVNEIEELTIKYGIEEIYDCSDEINNSMPHALAICEEIKRRNIDITWKSSVRANPLSEKLVKALAESGCWYVLLGIESGNEEVITGIKKGITLEQVESACRLFHKYGIKVQGLFMLYNVWDENGALRYEDTEMVRRTFKYMAYMVKEGLLDYVGWSITIPYPGSELYGIAVKHNLIKEDYIGHWEKWLVGDTNIMQLPGVNLREQIHLKTLGSVLRARLIFKNRDFKLKDLNWMTRKVFKLIVNEARVLGSRL